MTWKYWLLVFFLLISRIVFLVELKCMTNIISVINEIRYFKSYKTAVVCMVWMLTLPCSVSCSNLCFQKKKLFNDRSKTQQITINGIQKKNNTQKDHSKLVDVVVMWEGFLLGPMTSLGKRTRLPSLFWTLTTTIPPFDWPELLHIIFKLLLKPRLRSLSSLWSQKANLAIKSPNSRLWLDKR